MVICVLGAFVLLSWANRQLMHEQLLFRVEYKTLSFTHLYYCCAHSSKKILYLLSFNYLLLTLRGLVKNDICPFFK